MESFASAYLVTQASLEGGRLGEAREELNPRTYLGDREGRHPGAWSPFQGTTSCFPEGILGQGPGF